MELEEQHWRVVKELVSPTTRNLVLKSYNDGARGSQTKDRAPETVAPQYRGLAMKLIREISSWIFANVSELRKDGEFARGGGVCKWKSSVNSFLPSTVTLAL